MSAVADSLATAAAALHRAGIEQPRREAGLLLGHVLRLDRAALARDPGRRLSAAETTRLRDLTDRRVGREPFARIVGVREFWSLPFRLSPDTLVPRPDSETVVEAALDRVDQAAARPAVLDLGTGSGCLLLALLRELPDAWGVGVDLAPGAVMTARRNARDLGLADRARFCVADWARPIAGRFDLIVANPPYIPSGEIDGLAPEVAHHDPRRALDGGADGLDGARAVLAEVARLLAAGGVAVVECGAGQAAAVVGLARAAGLVPAGTRRDLAGHERCVMVSR